MSNLRARTSGEDHVVIKEESECGAEHKSDDVDGDVVGQRRGESQDVVREQQAELRDGDAADVGDEEEDGFAGGVVLGATAVGPQAVGDPRVERGGRGCDELRGVGVAGEDAERPVLEEVEQPHVDDERGRSDESELDEFARPGQGALGEGRGRGGPLVHVSWSVGLGTRRGRVRERHGFERRGRGFERGSGSARALFVVHSPSVACPRMRFYRHPSLYGLT